MHINCWLYVGITRQRSPNENPIAVTDIIASIYFARICEMNVRVTGMFNVLGIDLSENEIDGVLDGRNQSLESKRNWLRSFFKLEHPSELTRIVLIRYAEADAVMARIGFGTNQEEIYDRLIGTMVSSKRCYANAEYLACIELCALHGEMLANYLCITARESLEEVLSGLPQVNQDSIKADRGAGIYFANKINQTLRLRWLIKAGLISPDDRKRLLYAHGLRIKYFHHWSPKQRNEQQDAIKALAKLSPVTAKYLEILGSEPRTYNTANLERVKRYMSIVSGQPYVCSVLPSKLTSICGLIAKLWGLFLDFMRIKRRG